MEKRIRVKKMQFFNMFFKKVTKKRKKRMGLFIQFRQYGVYIRIIKTIQE